LSCKCCFKVAHSSESSDSVDSGSELSEFENVELLNRR